MGLRGPKPKPSALRALEGNPGRRNRSEPRPTPAAPPRPAWLCPVGAAKWDQLVPELSRLGLLTLVDGDVLAAYCQTWADYLWAVEELKRTGRTYKAVSGYMGPHPAVAIQRDARASLIKLGASFGMDPASRARFSVAPPEESDPLGDFLGGV